MMKISFLFVLALVCFSCGNSKKISVSQISNLRIEYDKSANINYGSELDVTVTATMLNGSTIDVTDNSMLQVDTNAVQIKGRSWILKGHPSNFEDATITVLLSMSDDEETYATKSDIVLNFKGDLLIDLSGKDGKDGEDQKDRSVGRVVLSSGKNGRDGTNGFDGLDGDTCKAYVWEDENWYYVHVAYRNDSKWYYKTDKLGTIIFDMSGGNGGKGGDAGEGGDGKDGKIKDDSIVGPGDGGDGGNGGNGGNGGDGGQLELFIHENSPDLASNINVDVSSGRGGSAGLGAAGGAAGETVEGATEASAGAHGINGAQGSNGKAGHYEGPQYLNFSLEDL